MLVPNVTCIYSPFVMPEILCPNFPVSRAFFGTSPVPLPSRLPSSPTFLTIYWIWSLHLLRLKSSTSSSFSDLNSDPRVLWGAQLQTCAVSLLLILPIQSVTKFSLVSFLLNTTPSHLFSAFPQPLPQSDIRVSDACNTFHSLQSALGAPFIWGLIHSSRPILLKFSLLS